MEKTNPSIFVAWCKEIVFGLMADRAAVCRRSSGGAQKICFNLSGKICVFVVQHLVESPMFPVEIWKVCFFVRFFTLLLLLLVCWYALHLG